MSQFTVHIDTSFDVFDQLRPSPETVLANCLQNVAMDVLLGETSGVIEFDGLMVGEWTWNE